MKGNDASFTFPLSSVVSSRDTCDLTLNDRGTELYPRIFGVDVKMFTNCRFGMMYWAVGAVIYAYAQHSIYGTLSSSMVVSAVVEGR